jgi:TfoX/Sxy family transcriptional regulator of competence genes
VFWLSIIGQSAKQTGNNAGSRSMAVDEDLAERMRAILGTTGAVREVRMFGGLCFMLNGNMLAGTSKRGLLVRVGKDQHSDALARPGAKPMEMAGRSMAGYIFVDPAPRDERALGDWLELAIAFVKTLPPKLPKSKSGRTKTK